MSQRIRSRDSSPASPSRSLPTTPRWNLRGRNLAIHRKEKSERIRFDTAAQVVEALTDRFGIDLTGLGDVEARVKQVMDT